MMLQVTLLPCPVMDSSLQWVRLKIMPMGLIQDMCEFTNITAVHGLN